MQGNQEEIRAINIVKNLFTGVDGDEITREQITEKITDKTFHNYSPLIQKHNLVTIIQDSGIGKKIKALRLTDKGKIVLNQHDRSAGDNSASQSLNIDAVGEYVDRFNRQSKYWELRLIPKNKKEAVEHR